MREQGAAPGGDLERLMTGYQAGEKRSVTILYRALVPQLSEYFAAAGASPDRVEALVERTLLEIHRARRSYDASRPFLPWMSAIARYVLVGMGRPLVPSVLEDDPFEQGSLGRHGDEPE
jgi:DNA-directed RNA polymerase specialized sigma24 family protein